MSEDMSVNPESGNTVNTIETAEQTIAESEAAIAETDAAIAANKQEFAAEFGDTPIDEFNK
jgi:hypothetical protein